MKRTVEVETKILKPAGENKMLSFFELKNHRNTNIGARAFEITKKRHKFRRSYNHDKT